MNQLRRVFRLILLWIQSIGKYNARRLKKRIKSAFVWYFGFEFLFFCRFKYLHRYINKYMPNTILNTNSTHMNHSYMEHLLQLITKYSKYHQNGVQGCIEEWFNHTKIKHIYKENVYEFLWWSFFVTGETSQSYQTLPSTEQKWRKNFVDNAYKQFENNIGHKFQQGYNHKISFLQNTKPGPINSIYHPLIMYIAIYIAQKFSDFYYTFIFGFKYKWINGLKVWYKISEKQLETKTKPILLIHGIGVYLFPYINFIDTLLKATPNQSIICVEIPWITVSVNNYITNSDSYIQHKLPSKTVDFVGIMCEMEQLMGVNKHNSNSIEIELDWTLIGHSYGTFIISGIYKYCKSNRIPIPKLVLIDPVCLCMCIPTTISAIEKTPKDWSLYILQLFAFKELQISCTLSRFTHWFQYVLFPDDLINDEFKHIVCIGTHDKIIPFEVINQGIIQVNNNCKTQTIHKIVFEHKGHAQWLSNKDCINAVVKTIV